MLRSGLVQTRALRSLQTLRRAPGRALSRATAFETTTAFDFTSIGSLADASVLATRGETLVHVAVAHDGIDKSGGGGFLPLVVNYRDRQYAHKRIPSAYNRRERHQSEPEILAARVLDRCIRPLFPKGLRTPQVTLTAHAVDGHTDPIPLSVNAASAALLRSRYPNRHTIPFFPCQCR